MTWPILISIPHCGLEIPPEIKAINLLTESQIMADGDEGALAIYDIKDHVTEFVVAEVARAYVDLNRPEDDRSLDGVVKTHTCWNEPIYKRPLKESEIEDLLSKYYRPYHQKLSHLSKSVKVGLDCHTMASHAPPISGSPDSERPMVCISDGQGACPLEWITELANCLKDEVEGEVLINDPFKGGFIIRSHCNEIPWIQIEFSRSREIGMRKKKEALLVALEKWLKHID